MKLVKEILIEKKLVRRARTNHYELANSIVNKLVEENVLA